MHVHDYEKLWLGASMVLIVLFIGTITYGSVVAGVSMVDDQASVVDPDNLEEEFPEPGIERVGQNEYVVNVIAFHPGFTPGTIEVPANSTVTFRITSRDVIHGFSVPGTNVNAMVIPGEVTSMTVEFDGPANYGIICNEYCGEFHHEMQAELRVVPESAFSLEADE